MLEITNLINQVAVIIQKNDEILELTGAKFNVFKLCGVYHYENVHSKIIAEFLNPKGSHGLQSKLLDCFIQTLSEKNLFSIANFDSKQAKVYTEYSTDQGRIDILIESQEKAIIIENKIYAYDQPEQLIRYQTFAEKKYQNFQIFYLTLWGDQASEQSSNGVEYKCISYQDLIIKWLESCVSLAARLPALRESLIQYIQLLKQLTNQDMDSQTTNEILNVLAKKGNLQAAKAIYQNYQDVFKQIVNEHFSPKMETFAKDNYLKYEFDSCQESYISFKFYKEGWNFWIGYYFEKDVYSYGICNNNPAENEKISEAERKQIESKLKEKGIQNPQSSDWWPYYKDIDPLTIEIWEEKIINNDTFVKECLKELSFLLGLVEVKL